mmetsp:Transcript_24087/g.40101  ORF Transcript_24087/g.40101 Transcript_24087/m.40101 type:complete len:473 (+) Transcript_24087:32-1450(+)
MLLILKVICVFLIIQLEWRDTLSSTQILHGNEELNLRQLSRKRSHVPLNDTQPVTLFQVLDTTFLPLWVNWWAIAVSLRIIPSNWNLHLACFGDVTDALVRRFHEPGCTRYYEGQIHRSKVYYAKWMAIADALRKGNNLLVVDIDAIMLRDPVTYLRLNEVKWDIIASRDHGPARLQLGNNWGPARLSTGLVYFKYSKSLLELVELVLKRCEKFGHGQTQFNVALARAGLTWSKPAEEMIGDGIDKEGYIPWLHQKDMDYTVVRNVAQIQTYNKQKLLAKKLLRRKFGVNTTEPPVKLNILLLSKDSVLHYCNKGGGKQKNALVPLSLTSNQQKRLSVLHCFVPAAAGAAIPAQGNKKRRFKQEIFVKLNLWVLKIEYQVHKLLGLGGLQSSAVPHPGSNVLQHWNVATLAMFEQFKRQGGIDELLSVWLGSQMPNAEALAIATASATASTSTTSTTSTTTRHIGERSSGGE